MKNTVKINTFILSVIFLSSINTAYAENIENNMGEIHIKETKNAESSAVSQEDKNNVGIINIDEFGKLKNNDIKGTPKTSESEYVFNTLNDIVSNQNKKNYEIALTKITDLSNQYPEYISLKKWKAIYQNRLFQFEDSNDTLDNITITFPLSLDKINKDKMILSYKLDNDMNLKKYDKAQKELQQLKVLIENTDENKKTNDIKDKDLYNIIYLYYDFFIDYNMNNQDINKDKLDNLWAKIPIEKQKELDIFYGFNLDDLEYVYGKFYNRKDLLKIYVQQENSSQDKNIIEKIKDAKSIIFEEY